MKTREIIYTLLNQFFSMNKVVTSLILFFFLSCNSTFKSKIEISQSISDNSVILRLSKQNTIIRIQFPNEISIQNNSFFSKSFVEIDYSYNKSMPMERDLGIGLFKKNDEILNSVSATGKRTIPSKQSLEYIYCTRHFVDSSKTTQQQFKPYIEKMLAENKDTLHIGTVSEFKQKHKTLFEQLTKGDSISIQFLDGKKLGERITVPVEW